MKRNQSLIAQDEWRRGEYIISADRDRLDIALIHEFISTKSYWGQGRSIETVRRSIEHSLPFGVYKGTRQIGFARVVTDRATFAWVADVFIIDEERGRKLGQWLIETILGHAELKGLRRWLLATKDAHELYRHFGFSELKRPERFMERPDPEMAESPDHWKNGESA